MCFALIGTDTSGARAQGSANDLIAAVNQLRQSNGLPTYQVNAALMAAAQAHSDYQASIGSITHTGGGGTRPKDRAIAAGYGGGATVYVSENIAGGTSMTYQRAVQMWQGDSLHLNTMLGGNYQDVGAGVTTSGSMTYFTLDVGYVAGASGAGSGTSSNEAATVSGTPPATPVAFYPVTVAKPGPDGSIVHVVQPGQTLWSIAATYEIELSDLLALNGYTSNTFIFPGDEVLIKSPDVVPSATAHQSTVSGTPTVTARPTRTPTRKTATSLAAMESTPTYPAMLLSTPVQSSVARSGTDPLLLAIALLVFGGTALIVIGFVLKRSE
jgi:LysM repeat protein